MCDIYNDPNYPRDTQRETKPVSITAAAEKRWREEEALDEALRNTFPASDPVSVEQPTLSSVKSQRDRMPSAGPHARPELMDADKTPGCGVLPPIGSIDGDGNAQPTG